MATAVSGPGDAIHCLPVAANASNRGLLNTQVFASGCEAGLNETIDTYSADLIILMDNRVNVTQQRAVLKILSKNFQREIKTIYDGGFS